MKALEAQIKEFNKAIEAEMQLLPNVLTSIPGIGPVISAGIIAEIGDINRFPNQAKLGKYAGLAWKQHQSGDFDSEHTRLIQSGNRFLKYYLYEGAFSLVKCDIYAFSTMSRNFSKVYISSSCSLFFSR